MRSRGIYLLSLRQLQNYLNREPSLQGGLSLWDRIGDERRKKAGQMRPEHAKLAQLGAGLLLQLSFLPREELYGEVRFLSPEELLELIPGNVPAQGAGAADVPYGPCRIGEHGKPYFTDPALPFFNLSHSGDLVGIVFADVECGLDLQEYRTLDMEALARRFFSEGDAKALREMAEEQRREAFFRFWTRREAYGKALGCGLLPVIGLDFRKIGLYGLLPEDVCWEEPEVPGRYAMSVCYRRS